MKLGNIAEIIAGQPAGKDNLVDNGDIRYVSAKDITPAGELNTAESRYLKSSNERHQRAIIKSGDILMINTGVNIGLLSEYTAEQVAMAGSSLFIVRSEQAGLLDQLSAKAATIKSLVKGVAMLRVSIKDMKELEL